MASPFAKYQSEQVQQIAPGFVEAFAKQGASIGQGIASVGSSVAKGMEAAEQKKIEEAKQRGAITPYLQGEVANVERSIENGFLVKGADGKVSIAAGQEGNLDANKIGRAISLYNQTDGGKKALKSDELAGVVSTIQSYDALEKQAADRAKAARDAKIAEVEYQTKLLGQSATLAQGISDFASQRRQLGIAAGMQGDVPSAQQAIAESRALEDKALSVRLDGMRNAGINVDAYLPPPPVAPPVRPAAAAVGSGASTLYTVPTGLEPSTAPSPAPAPVNQAVATKPAPAVEAPVAGTSQAPAPVAAAPSPASTPASKPTARQLQTGQMPAVAPATAPAPTGQPAVAGRTPSGAITPSVALVQAEAEIKSLQGARKIAIDTQNNYKTMAAIAGLDPSQIQEYRKLSDASLKIALDIDDQITKKMTLIATEKASVESGRIGNVKLGMEQAKAADERIPDFGGGYMARGRALGIKKYGIDNLASALTDLSIPGIKGQATEIVDTIASVGSFMDSTMAIEDALDERLEKGGVGLFSLLTLDKGDYEAYTKGNVGEKILLASMRKAIVSGGNFSDADRQFVLESIAAINNLDVRKREPYLKALNKTMAEMVMGMYDKKLKAQGVERHLELLTEEERKEAVSPTEVAFRSRFGIDDSGKASNARAELQSIISSGRKESGFGASKASAASALDKFVADAKAEAEQAKQAK